MALPATDDFNRNDSSNDMQNSSWTPIWNSWGILTGYARGNAGTNNSFIRWNADSFDADQYSTATYKGQSYGGPAVRMSGTIESDATCYFAELTFSAGRLKKIVNGSYTTLNNSVGDGVVDTDVVYLEVSGVNPGTLVYKENGTTIVTDSTDSEIDSGAAGLGTSWGNALFDNWEGGNLTAAGTGGPFPARYFAEEYWARRYFPGSYNDGAATPSEVWIPKIWIM